MRILAIDHGERRSGLALSDFSGLIASPLEVVEGNDGVLCRRVEELVEAEEVERVVVGLPLNMDGTAGPRARRVEELCRRLAGVLPCPVETWDERLTTVQAEGLLRDSGLTRAKRRRRVDKVAAQLLLQSFLDARRRSS